MTIATFSTLTTERLTLRQLLLEDQQDVLAFVLTLKLINILVDNQVIHERSNASCY